MPPMDPAAWALEPQVEPEQVPRLVHMLQIREKKEVQGQGPQLEPT